MRVESDRLRRAYMIVCISDHWCIEGRAPTLAALADKLEQSEAQTAADLRALRRAGFVEEAEIKAVLPARPHPLVKRVVRPVDHDRAIHMVGNCFGVAFPPEGNFYPREPYIGAYLLGEDSLGQVFVYDESPLDGGLGYDNAVLFHEELGRAIEYLKYVLEERKSGHE